MGTDTSRERHDHSRGPSCDTAIESFDPGIERTLRHKPQDGDEVEEARSSSPTRRWVRRMCARQVLSKEEEALVVAFRRHTLLPLDDCLYALQATVPHLTRSSLHRLFQRHDISRLPGIEGAKPRKKFKAYPIGYFHIDIAEVWTEEGKLYMFVAIDRVSNFAFAELHERATRRVAADFLRKLIELVPYKIHTVLTDNGIHFTVPGGASWSVPEIKAMIERKEIFRAHSFDVACARNDIDHRLTKPNYPWTNGQVERMNRTIKEATVRRYYYESHDRLRAHLAYVPRRLQLRQTPEEPQRPNPLRAHLQNLDRAAAKVQAKPNPSHGGTEQPSLRPSALGKGSPCGHARLHRDSRTTIQA